MLIDGIDAAPAIDVSRIHITRSSHTQAHVEGEPNAVRGAQPLALQLRNTRSGATSAFTAEDDGTFAVEVAVADGDTLTLTATDTHGRSTGPVTLGTVLPVAPSVQLDRITLATDGAGNAVVTGTAGAVSGDGTLTAQIRNMRNQSAGASVTVAADGSFTATVSAEMGDFITLTASNGAGQAGPFAIGRVPWQTGRSTVDLTDDDQVREQKLLVSGRNLLVQSTYQDWNPPADRLKLYDVTNPSTPTFVRDISAYGAPQLAVTDDVVYFGGREWGLRWADLRIVDAPVQLLPGSEDDFFVRSLLVVGTKLYVATYPAGLRVYDVSNRMTPQLLGSVFTDDDLQALAPVGTNHLAALVNSGYERDFYLYDVSDVHDIHSVAVVSVADADFYQMTVTGTALYLGSSYGIYQYDVSDVTAPQLVAKCATAPQPAGFSSTATSVGHRRL